MDRPRVNRDGERLMMMQINLMDWHTRNCWLMPSGELATRPGCRVADTYTSDGDVVHAFSVPNYGLDEYHHYLFYMDATTKRLTLRVYDEDLVTVFQKDLKTTARPRDINWGTTLNELVICSPDFPMLWGIVGGPVVFASSEPSDNEDNTPAIDIPRGVGVSWASRFVIADGTNLYISDPVDILGGSPRTFTGVNQQWRPGEIYALHVDAGGNLIACSSSGVWRLPADAAAAGQEAIGEWRLVSTHETTGYRKTAMFNGRLFGLSRRGYRLIDVEGSPEIPLDDPQIPLSNPRIARNDWRTAYMLPGEFGPIIVSKEHHHFLMVDVDRKFSSWWNVLDSGLDRAFETPSNYIVGSFKTFDGEEWLVSEDTLVKVGGNANGLVSYSDESLTTQAYVYGRVNVAPTDSPTWRSITIGSTSNQQMQVRFRSGTALAEDTEEELTPPVEGVDGWEDGLNWGKRRLRSHRFDLDEDESRDPTFEFRFRGSLERIMATAELEVDGLAKRRPT